MTLRTKLLALLTLLAAGPLLAIGVIGYALSLGAVAAQLESQTRPISERAAEEIRRRAQLVESDLLLLAENAETERLLELVASSGGSAGAGSPALEEARAAVDTFFAAAWTVFAPSYASIELHDARGSALLWLGRRPRAAGEYDEYDDSDYADGARLVDYTVQARPREGEPRGSVRGLVRLEALLAPDALDARFGHRGVSAVVHVRTGRLLHFADAGDRAVRRLADAGLGGMTPGMYAESGALRLGSGDARRVGWVTVLSEPPVAVLALAERDEFAAPFRRQRAALFALVLLLAALVVPAGAVLLRRATRSLEELTLAADRVGRGDFAPELPQTTGDEVGRLSGAFRAMVGEVRRMMAELERSRQLAAVGEFAAELSHEIRNPLTAIKLNLQRLERMVAEGEVHEKGRRPVAIALAEIARLDRVVRSALRLGRPAAPVVREALAVDTLVAGALELVRPQLLARGVEVHVEGAPARILGDEEQLRGALVNLLLNALEAMPDGGTLHVRTALREMEGGSWAQVHLADTGTGIPESARPKLFQPFFTTREEGTGLGLALALRAVEAHGGTITLVHSSPAGTEFSVRLPLAPEAVPA